MKSIFTSAIFFLVFFTSCGLDFNSPPVNPNKDSDVDEDIEISLDQVDVENNFEEIQDENEEINDSLEEEENEFYVEADEISIEEEIIIEENDLEGEIFEQEEEGEINEIIEDEQNEQEIEPPDTFITRSPSDPSEVGFAIFEFGCDKEPCSFECRIDSSSWSSCSSPYIILDLIEGTHLFEVRAIDSALNVDSTPANYSWRISSISQTRISAGYTHTCAVTRSGSVKCWGSNSYGELGNGTTTGSPRPVDVISLTPPIKAVSSGRWFSCALTSSGGVKCWGYNQSGQLGDGTTENHTTPVDVTGLSSGVIAISTGFSHACALLNSGGVKCWGENESGQIGDGTLVDKTSPVDVTGLGSGVVAISAGGSHTCAITISGNLYCWGYNRYGQIGDGSTTDRVTPTPVSGLGVNATKVSANFKHTCALLSNGTIKCWGGNDSGQLGDGTTTESHLPVTVLAPPASSLIVSSGGTHTCAIDNSGRVWCWGDNSYGQIGDGTTTGRLSPVNVSGMVGEVVMVSAGQWHTCAVTSSNNARCWGYNYTGQLGNGTYTSSSLPVDVTGLSTNAVFISAGTSHTCAITASRGVKCWGRNSDGQLGDGTNLDSTIPVDVTGLPANVTSLASGHYHTCAVLETGSVYCWGRNIDGQLGDGTTINRNSPVRVTGFGGGDTAVLVSAGSAHTCVLLSSGLVKCWGDNSSGQLGNGTTTDSLTPVTVSGLPANISSISSGNMHNCVLGTSGGVKCWGRNSDGQLGDGTTATRTTPVDVTGLSSSVSEISAKNNHSCALLTDGSMKCWGDNSTGQLGDGTGADRLIPVNVTGIGTGVQKIAAGNWHTCALTTSGSVKCWGLNTYGELGDGTNIDSNTPVSVTGLGGGVVSVAGGGWHTCAVMDTGRAKCWGYNLYGQLGDGSTVNSNIPVYVSGF